MDKPAEKRQLAWQPLTPRGVAAFATASFGRLWLVQLVVAFICALSVVWFVYTAWVPVVSEAINELPSEAEIRRAKLRWNGPSPQCLAESRFLSISIDLKHEGQARSPAHIQIELGEKTIKALSLVGFAETSYPTGWRIGLGQTEAEAWWGAWMPALLAMVAGATVAALMIIWAVLGFVYSGPGWLLVFFASRGARLSAIWRLAGAALLPGAVFLSVSIVLYGSGALDLLLLGLAAGLHLLIGWIYLVWAIFCLPVRKEEQTADVNPFAAKRD